VAPSEAFAAIVKRRRSGRPSVSSPCCTWASACSGSPGWTPEGS
jgi:hypothetical protein